MDVLGVIGRLSRTMARRSTAADVFISYSQKDRLAVEQLSAFLEAQGWSVWFDKSLTAGEAWRDEIGTQLVRARAVLVVWTPNSIKSDFVRAEAQRAQLDAKLIPVKAAGVEYRDIPLPFGEIAYAPLENREAIRAAMVMQLAKPQVVPTGIWVATASVRYAALTWFGIIGAAITLFGNLRGVLELADWAGLLVRNWEYWTSAFWFWAFGWLGIQLPSSWVPIVSFVAFAAATVVGGKLSLLFSLADASDGMVEHRDFRISNLLIALAGSGVIVVLYVLFIIFLFPLMFNLNVLYEQPVIPFVSLGLTLILLVSIFVVLLSSRAGRIQAIISVFLFAPLAFSLLVLPSAEIMTNTVYRPALETYAAAQAAGGTEAAAVAENLQRTVVPYFLFVLFLLVSVVPVAATQLPARRLNRRFLFILVGLGFLLGLNELSKLNIGQYLLAGV